MVSIWRNESEVWNNIIFVTINLYMWEEQNTKIEKAQKSIIILQSFLEIDTCNDFRSQG
jgi:hypothetical protein